MEGNGSHRRLFVRPLFRVDSGVASRLHLIPGILRAVAVTLFLLATYLGLAWWWHSTLRYHLNPDPFAVPSGFRGAVTRAVDEVLWDVTGWHREVTDPFAP